MDELRTRTQAFLKNTLFTPETGTEFYERLFSFVEEIHAAGEKSGAGKAVDYISTKITERGTHDLNYDDIYEAGRSISGEEKVWDFFRRLKSLSRLIYGLRGFL